MTGKSRWGGGSVRRIQFAHGYESIISVENLLGAWEEFVRGKRKKKDVQEFQHYMMDNILALHRELKEETYRHGPYHAFKISDPKENPATFTKPRSATVSSTTPSTDNSTHSLTAHSSLIRTHADKEKGRTER